MSSVMTDASRSRRRSWTASEMTSRRSTSDGGLAMGWLNFERLRMISRARPLCVLMNEISSRTRGPSSGWRSSSSAVPRMAWSGLFSSCATPETVHLALLTHLPVERVPGIAQISGHHDERVLQLRQLPVGRRQPRRGRQIAVRDAPGRRSQPIEVQLRLPRHDQAEH
jgi:hypothetical protein